MTPDSGVGVVGWMVVVAVAWVVAAWLHEATHAVMVYALGGRVEGVDWVGLEVVASGLSEDRHRLVAASPFLIGAAVGVASLVSGTLPSSVAGGGGYVIYTFGGVFNDGWTALGFRDSPWRRLSQEQRDGVLSVVVLWSGVLVTYLPVIGVGHYGWTILAGSTMVVVGLGYGLWVVLHTGGDPGSSPGVERVPGAEASYPAVGRNDSGDSFPESTRKDNDGSNPSTGMKHHGADQ